MSKRSTIPTKSRKGITNGRATRVKFMKDTTVVYAYGNMKQVMFRLPNIYNFQN